MEREELQSLYRKTIGLFATGVTVVIAEREGKIRGMTANAVTSLSLDPLQLIFCPSKTSRFTENVEVGVPFTVNMLTVGQRAVSDFFARSPDEPLSVGRNRTDQVEFDLLRWPRADSAPFIDGSLGAISCTVAHIHEGGDHWIVCGDVNDLHRSIASEAPLLFFDGKYREPTW